jgi:integrase/recombinase XerD
MTEFKSILKVELSDFLSLRKISKSKSAYDHDCHTLRIFDEYLVDINCTSKNLMEDQVTDWIRTIEGKSSTIANVVIVIRLFLENLKSYGINPYIPPTPKIRDDYIPYIFSDNEMRRIFGIADSLQKVKPVKNIFIHNEFPMILRLMYGCGLRAGESLSLRMKDIDLEIGVLTLNNTKGDKQRLVPMHHSLTKILERYCIAMGIMGYPEANLFPTIVLTEAVTVHSAQHKFNDILKLADISLMGRQRHQRGPCLHCLRHVFVFKSFRSSENTGRRINETVSYLSLYLGHDSLKETEKYLKFSSELFPESMELFEAYTSTVFPEVNYDGE